MEYKELKEAQSLPSFSLPDQNGELWSQKNLAGRWFVLFCYPKDNTPGCTIEAIDFTKNKAAFDTLGVPVLGLSPDDEKSHCKFIEKQALDITLLCDPAHAYLDKLGVWREKSFLGKKYMGVFRSTFIIDPKGRIAKAMYGVKPLGHVKEVLSALKVLIKG